MTKKIETWITGATLVTQDSKRRIIDASIRIVDNTIVDITTKSPPRSRKKNVKIIDANGKTILPGFVQAHVHLCQTLFRNQADDLELLDWLSKRIWVMEAAHTPETLYTSAKLGIYELLSTGTTTILDMGTVRHTEAILKAAKDFGIRGSFGKCLMDHPSTTPENLRDTTQDALTEARTLFKKYNDTSNGRIQISYAPRFVISCTERLLAEVAKLSHEQKARIHTHASENLKEIQMVKKLVHCENVEYLHQLGLTSEQLVLAHCIWLKPNEKEILARTGTHVVHCPSSNLKLASGFAHVPDLLKRKINVALGADGAPCNNNLSMFNEMKLAALIHKPANGPRSMQAQEALDMATRNGAKALGLEKSVGSIEIGKKADLIALNLERPESLAYSKNELISSIVYSSGPLNLFWTMVDGNVLFAQGKVRGIQTHLLINEVRKAQNQINLTIKRKA